MSYESNPADHEPLDSGNGAAGGSRSTSAQHPEKSHSVLKRMLDFFDSTTKVLLAVGGLIAAAVAVWTAIPHLAGQSSKLASSGAVASHQYVVAPESCGALTFGADGAAWPVTCPDGRPNSAADRYYRQLKLRVLSLISSANPRQVNTAICADLATGNSTFPIETRAVELAQAEQGWHFGIPSVDDIGPGLCPRN